MYSKSSCFHQNPIFYKLGVGGNRRLSFTILVFLHSLTFIVRGKENASKMYQVQGTKSAPQLEKPRFSSSSTTLPNTSFCYSYRFTSELSFESLVFTLKYLLTFLSKDN